MKLSTSAALPFDFSLDLCNLRASRLVCVFRRAERRIFAQKYVKIFTFFPSVTSIYVSFLSIKLSRHLLLGCIQFLYKHYDSFRIYFSLKFQPPKNVFVEFPAKKFSFQGFLQGKGIFVSPVFTVSLEMRMLLR